ncbi:MAG: YfbU family protein [Paracoccus sp.]|nr:YfbU family protein [Paracoccus sp. (in: a-proteobacteria)]
MSAKTERFEMRLDEGLLEKIDNWRERQNQQPSRAEAIRTLVELGLSGTDLAIRPNGHDRLMMWMMAEVLKQQKGSEGKDTAKLVQQAIYGGHFWALEWQLRGILHSSLDSPEDVKFVVDVLDMWDFIEISYSKLSASEKDKIEAAVGPIGRNPKFIGFDGNNETELMSIATFLVRDLNRFSHFSERSFNSHMPKADRYRKMLDQFEPMRRDLLGIDLDADQIIRLLQRD